MSDANDDKPKSPKIQTGGQKIESTTKEGAYLRHTYLNQDTTTWNSITLLYSVLRTCLAKPFRDVFATASVFSFTTGSFLYSSHVLGIDVLYTERSFCDQSPTLISHSSFNRGTCGHSALGHSSFNREARADIKL
jgi:hypothetical protein